METSIPRCKKRRFPCVCSGREERSSRSWSFGHGFKSLRLDRLVGNNSKVFSRAGGDWDNAGWERSARSAGSLRKGNKRVPTTVKNQNHRLCVLAHCRRQNKVVLVPWEEEKYVPDDHDVLFGNWKLLERLSEDEQE